MSYVIVEMDHDRYVSFYMLERLHHKSMAPVNWSESIDDATEFETIEAAIRHAGYKRHEIDNGFCHVVELSSDLKEASALFSNPEDFSDDESEALYNKFYDLVVKNETLIAFTN